MTYVKQTWANGAGGGTPTSAARLGTMEDGIFAASITGELIDSAERSTLFDVQAIGVTYTEVEGLTVVVPARVRPFKLELNALALFYTGTSANGTQQGMYVTLREYDITTNAAGSDYDITQIETFQVGTTTKAKLNRFVATRVFDPTSTDRMFKVLARTLVATPSGWAGVQLYAENPPVSGTFAPMLLTAVGL